MAALLFVAIGPAVLAFRCWGAGVERVGPNIAALFINFTPLFAALLSSMFLGELPHLYHGVAFVMMWVVFYCRPAAKLATKLATDKSTVRHKPAALWPGLRQRRFAL